MFGVQDTETLDTETRSDSSAARGRPRSHRRSRRGVADRRYLRYIAAYWVAAAALGALVAITVVGLPGLAFVLLPACLVGVPVLSPPPALSLLLVVQA